MNQKFSTLIQSYDAVIGYTPLPDEIQYDAISILPYVSQTHTKTPLLPMADPFAFAEACVEKYSKLRPYVLVPGRTFDVLGNRRGRGGGWYDRFLSKIPDAWLRVGIIDSTRFSATTLLSRTHDIPVHWIIIYDSVTAQISIHETNQTLKTM